MKTKVASPYFYKAFLYFIFFCVFGATFISVHTASSDALDNWNKRGIGVTTEDLEAVVYGNNTFIAVGSNGTIVSSDDGSSWTNLNSGTTKWIKAITYSNQKFKAVGWEGAYLTSDDGKQWNTQILATINDYHYDIINAGGLYVVAGFFNDIDPEGNVINSLDGINWNVDTMSFTPYHYGIAYGANTYVVTGSSGKILSSPDCDIWTEETSGSGPNLISVGFANDLFVVVGADGVILTSSNGHSWSIAGTVTSETLFEVQFCQEIWITVGAKGTLLTSTEGNNWNARNSGTNSNLKGIAFGNDTIVAVGENGLILQSDPFDTANVPKDSNVDSDDGGDESCFISTMKQ